MMWQAIGILLLGANPSTVAPDGFDGGIIPSPSDHFDGASYGEDGQTFSPGIGGDGGAGCGPCGWFGRPCFFDSYWDYTGSRSPTNYSLACGYGPDWCYTWQGRMEWLMFFSRGRNAPVLVTSSSLTTPRDDAGVLGMPTTRELYGGAEPIGEDMRNGARITFGRMLGDNITTLTGRFWGVENGVETVAGDSSDRAIFARPFFNLSTGEQDAFLVSFPGVTAPASMHIQSRNNLFGGDAYLSRNAIHDPWLTLDFLAGYQFTRIDDSTVIRSLSNSIDPLSPLPVGTDIAITDSFRTQNQFHGASLGFLADFRHDVMSLEVLGKIAFGNVRQSVIVDGETTLTPPGGGAPTTTNNGLLALPSNIGSFERNRFAVAPELNINVLWHFTPQLKAVCGYSILYWSNVVLSGNQIDTTLNLTQVPGPIVGPAFPRAHFQRTDFLAQGINIGMDYRW